MFISLGYSMNYSRLNILFIFHMLVNQKMDVRNTGNRLVVSKLSGSELLHLRPHLGLIVQFPSLSGDKKLDGVSRFFHVLQDLQDSHTAVEEEEKSKNKNLLLELQT